MAHSKEVQLRICTTWPFNMLRIRAEPQRDADVIHTILPIAFAGATFTGVDVGEFWKVFEPLGIVKGYVVKVYEGYQTLETFIGDTLEKDNQVAQAEVVVMNLSGDVIYGPAMIPSTLTVGQFKTRLRTTSSAHFQKEFQLLLDQQILRDSDRLSDRFLDLQSRTALTLVEIYRDVYEAVDLWRTFVADRLIHHTAYGDGGAINMRLEFQPPLEPSAECNKAPSKGATKMNVEALREQASRWPWEPRFSLRGSRTEESLAAAMKKVADIAEKYSMEDYSSGSVGWSPRWECWLCADGWSLPLKIHQNCTSCNLCDSDDDD
jgi:hypothetical protein